jgi:hypothetical protein
VARETDTRTSPIRTPDQRLRVFVSSTLEELAVERRSVRRAIESLRLSPVMFELGARPHPARALYRAYLDQSHVFVGVYWQRYGWVAPEETISGLEDEYLLSSALPRLVYLKEPAPDRDVRLSLLLDRIRSDDTTSYKRFSTSEDLEALVVEDLALLLSERFLADRRSIGAAEPSAGVDVPQLSANGRMAARLSQAASRGFVGREDELQRLRDAVKPDSPEAVVFLHGPGGIGKSALLRAFASRYDGRFVRLDGRDVEPTPSGFVSAMAESMGCSPESLLADVLDSFGDGPAVLAVDNFERVPIIDAWLRDELLPLFPDGVTTILVGRNGPNAAWRTAPGWHELMLDVSLGPLPSDAARAMLTNRRVIPTAVDRVLEFAKGYPLVLELAAAAARSGAPLDFDPTSTADLVTQVVEILVDDLSAVDLELVETVSVVRRLTEPMLEALLAGGEVESRLAWRTLSHLPFVDITPFGLEMNDVVREVISRSLELRDPERERSLRQRAARHLLRRRTPERTTWGDTADLLFLIRIPVVRHAFFPPDGVQHPVESARPDDSAAIRSIAERHLDPIEVALVDEWWARHPDHFIVARAETGRPLAFSVVIERADISPDLAVRDPIVAAWSAHLDDHALPEGSKVLCNRYALSEESGEQLSSEQAVLWIDIKRAYLEMRPWIERVYVAVSDWVSLEPVMSHLGFRAAGHVDVGNRTEWIAALDMGERSVEGWLSGLLDTELDINGASVIVDP